MPPVPTDSVDAAGGSVSVNAPASSRRRRAVGWSQRLRSAGPIAGLVLLCIAGTLLNPDFATWDNAMNVLTRTAFIGIIAVGMSFVIISGGIDLSVGSMAALIAGSVILVMNWVAPHVGSPLVAVLLGMVVALVLGAAFGLAHGLLITRGRIEPFIVTLGTLGIFRAYLTYFANGGAITLDNALADVYGPVYYGSVLGIPIPIGVFGAMALAGGFLLNRTRYGRYVQAIGSNEHVARYAAVAVDRAEQPDERPGGQGPAGDAPALSGCRPGQLAERKGGRGPHRLRVYALRLAPAGRRPASSSGRVIETSWPFSRRSDIPIRCRPG